MPSHDFEEVRERIGRTELTKIRWKLGLIRRPNASYKGRRRKDEHAPANRSS